MPKVRLSFPQPLSQAAMPGHRQHVSARRFCFGVIRAL